MLALLHGCEELTQHNQLKINPLYWRRLVFAFWLSTQANRHNQAWILPSRVESSRVELSWVLLFSNHAWVLRWCIGYCLTINAQLACNSSTSQTWHHEYTELNWTDIYTGCGAFKAARQIRFSSQSQMVVHSLFLFASYSLLSQVTSHQYIYIYLTEQQ